MSGALRITAIKGFTLLEVLIAISIFAIISLGSYRVLDRVMLSQESIKLHSDRLKNIQRGMLIIASDMRQLARRSIRDENGDRQPALSTTESGVITFTRYQWVSPLQLPRSDLLRVSYELVDDLGDENGRGSSLIRKHWKVLDRARGSDFYEQMLISGLRGVELQFLGSRGDWVDSWPKESADDNDEVLPVAIKIEFLFDEGDVQRIFQIAELAEESSRSG